MRYWQWLGVPLLIWAVAVGAVTACAAAFGYDPLDAGSWSRWDSVHYVGIARGGFDLYRCPTDYAPDPDGWCGNAGWFPAYSWLVGGLHRLGLPLLVSAVTVFRFFAGATLVLLWNTFFARRKQPAVLAALVYAAWVPGQIYHYSIFPLSMLAFFTAGQLWLLRGRRHVAAGVAGGIAALTYPLGVLLAPVSAAWLLARRSVPIRERFRRTVATSGLTLMGVAGLALDQRLETGHWNAYLLVQRKYHHDLQNPIAALRDSLDPLMHGSPFELAKAPALQTVVVTAALLAVLVHALLRRHSYDPFDRAIMLWAVVTWAAPLSQAAVSLQRSQAALLPLAVLVRRLPRPVIFMLAVAAIPVAVAMEKLFLQGKIV
jgi:hypothetical protein